jgi:hypothetical protein
VHGETPAFLCFVFWLTGGFIPASVLAGRWAFRAGCGTSSAGSRSGVRYPGARSWFQLAENPDLIETDVLAARRRRSGPRLRCSTSALRPIRCSPGALQPAPARPPSGLRAPRPDGTGREISGCRESGAACILDAVALCPGCGRLGGLGLAVAVGAARSAPSGWASAAWEQVAERPLLRRKLGGILIELSGDVRGPSAAVVGSGSMCAWTARCAGGSKPGSRYREPGGSALRGPRCLALLPSLPNLSRSFHARGLRRSARNGCGCTRGGTSRRLVDGRPPRGRGERSSALRRMARSCSFGEGRRALSLQASCRSGCDDSRDRLRQFAPEMGAARRRQVAKHRPPSRRYRVPPGKWGQSARCQVVVANVAGPAVPAAEAILADRPRPSWVRAKRRECGVTNGYRRPAQLGADRWAALIGAWSILRGPCLVVAAGTATTADVLKGDGTFAGGAILPGLELMKHRWRPARTFVLQGVLQRRAALRTPSKPDVSSRRPGDRADVCGHGTQREVRAAGGAAGGSRGASAFGPDGEPSRVTWSDRPEAAKRRAFVRTYSSCCSLQTSATRMGIWGGPR